MSTKDVTDKMVVLAAAEFSAKNRQGERCECPMEKLSAETGEPFKVVYRAYERAERRGLIDYGVSLRTAWPTDAGLALINST